MQRAVELLNSQLAKCMTNPNNTDKWFLRAQSAVVHSVKLTPIDQTLSLCQPCVPSGIRLTPDEMKSDRFVTEYDSSR